MNTEESFTVSVVVVRFAFAVTNVERRLRGTTSAASDRASSSSTSAVKVPPTTARLR